MTEQDQDLQFYRTLGKNLRAARERIGMSISDLAIASGVTAKNIENYESTLEIIPIYDFLALAKAMNYPSEIEPKNNL